MQLPTNVPRLKEGAGLFGGEVYDETKEIMFYGMVYDIKEEYQFGTGMLLQLRCYDFLQELRDNTTSPDH